MPQSNSFQDLFQQLRDRASSQDTAKSYQWYMTQIRKLGLTAPKPANVLKSNIGELVTTVRWGDMYLFFYDPKTKDKLKYYDRFPLVIPFRVIRGGFLGLNLHYLPPLLRDRLLARLMKLADNSTLSQETRLRFTWNIIKNAARYPEVAPCVKKYLVPNVRSRFLKINPTDWRTTIMLPTETFIGDTKQNVYRISQDIINA